MIHAEETYSDIKKVFGAAVRSWRTHLNLSQEELAERADLHPTYVGGIERGVCNPSLASIKKLARALQISTASLFSTMPPETGSKPN